VVENGVVTFARTARTARRWTDFGLRAVVCGLLAVPLALASLVTFVFAAVGLAAVAVPGVGLLVLPATIWLVRVRADLERAMAARMGVAIARPYLPEPERRTAWRRFQWVATDPATWRDVAWLVPDAISGLILGTLAFALPLYGLHGVLLLPLWLHLGDVWYGYGVFWPVATLAAGWSSLPQGLIILGVGLTVAPWLMWVHYRFAKLFLSPTRTARLALRVQQLTVTRSDSVDAQAAELRRIERDLHDGAQARIASLGMSIGLAEELMHRDPDAARQLLTDARAASSEALVELRHLVRGIHPPVLAERGLAGAVRALALGLPLPVVVDLDLPGRADTPVESAAYFAVAEALANVTKHSNARQASVVGRYLNGTLSLVVRDDGCGGADPATGTGLRGIRQRLAAFDGTMTLSSLPGGPTLVALEIPCVMSAPASPA
jgi:signal transduction histidine kinase